MKCPQCDNNMKIPPDWRAILISLAILVTIGFMFFYLSKHVKVLEEHPCSICERGGYTCLQGFKEVETDFDRERSQEQQRDIVIGIINTSFDILENQT